MTPTLRRLDDREAYWGLTWPGWVAAILSGGLLYLAVRSSPFGTRPTVTLTVFALAFTGMVLYGLSGQALSPGRQLRAILAYHLHPKTLELAAGADRRGLVLSTAAPELATSEPAAAGFAIRPDLDRDTAVDWGEL